MKILHTADWHIGQSFYAFDRAYEHQHFLNWLVNMLQEEKIDVLLVSGDIFDSANPSAASVHLFYRFLKEAEKSCPGLQMVITAGNHDSAARLEAPVPLLESTQVHIVGMVARNENGQIDYEKLVVPLKSSTGEQLGWCLAVPFLRLGDYPAIAGVENAYAAGVSELYHQAFSFIEKQNREQLPVIALGHLHAQKAITGDMDRQERMIMGGIDGIPISAFSDDFAYVALGHIHKAQRIGGEDHIRYSGSPLPMSFSELHYQHQVIVFELEKGGIKNIRPVKIPLAIPLKRIPYRHEPLSEVLKQIKELPAAAGQDTNQAPYLEVCVMLEGPEPELRHKLELELEGKFVRLAKIDVRYLAGNDMAENPSPEPDVLERLHPMDVFNKVYQNKYGTDAPDDLKALFQEAAQGAHSVI